MTIKISKPAFNLRDKISELDCGHVSYQKMPSGSVVDIAYAYNSTQSTHTNQHTTCVGPVTINRKNSYNSIWLYTSVEYYHNNANGKFSFQVSFDDGTNWVNLFDFHGEDDPMSTNEYNTLSITGSYLYDEIATGSLSSYVDGGCMNPQFRTRFNHVTQNGGTLYLNRGKAGTNFFDGSCTLTAMEIGR